MSSEYESISRNLMSNISAGTIIAYSTFPLEGMKKMIQSNQIKPREVFKSMFVGNNTIFELLKNSWRNGHFHLLYRGSTVFAINIVPTTTIQLTTDSILKGLLPANPSVAQNIGVSVLAGITGALTATFVENTIVRQQIMRSGPWSAIKDMLSISLLRPWKTYPHIATRDGIFTFTMLWAVPETVKYVNKNLDSSYEFPARMSVSLIGAALSHPVDTIATQLQTTHENKSSYDVAKKIIQENGYKGFYKGFACRFTLFTAFSNAIPVIKRAADQYISSKFFPDSADATRSPMK